jgi:hypothetical protein
MKFQRFVSRTTKGIFVFLVAIMAISLVLSGTMGGGAEKGEEGEAGVIFENVPVSMRDWGFHFQKATPAYYWNNWLREALDPMAQYRRRRPPMKPQPPKEDVLEKMAWENAILLEDARRKGITASEKEATARFRDIFDAITRGQLPQTEDSFQQIASVYFHTNLTVLQAWLTDLVILEKLTDLVEEGEFADFGRVYGEIAKGHRRARIWTCSLDPKEFARELKPVRPEEVSKYYEANKARYQVGEKVQISYLMAEYDEFKKKVADPSEEEIKKFYEDHKGEFQKSREEHSHAPGEEHKDDEPPQVKPFDEVREQIPDRIRTEKARLEAKKVMDRVDKEIGAAYKDDKYPEDLFDTLKAKYGREGIALSHDVTGVFDAKHAEDVEKVLGENGDLRTWPFEGGRKAGEISKRNDTTKGSLFYRIQKRNASYDPGLTEPVRKAIEKDLEKQQIQKRSSQTANNIVQTINKSGFAAARRKYPVEWRASRYFSLKNPAEAGLEEPMLAQAVARQLRDGQQLNMERRATTIPGGMISWSPEKREWTYVVYLEDVLESFPSREEAETEFKSERARVDQEVREKYRRDFITRTVASANLKDLRVKKSEDKKAPEPKG